MSVNDNPTDIGHYIDVLRRRRWYWLIALPVIFLLAVFIAFFLTPTYRASSTILLEPSSIPQELVKTTVTGYADEQIELVMRRVLTPDRLEEIVKDADPYPDEKSWTAADKANQLVKDTVVERVDPVTLETVRESNAFAIRYHNESPKRAVDTAERLSELFLTYNRQARSEQAAGTYEFLASQAKSIEQRIVVSEQRLADFRARHGDALPEFQARNQAVAERADRDLVDYESQIRAAEDRQTALNLQLSRVAPMLGSTTGNPQTELATLQGQLAEARVRYTPDHPDVKRLQRQIETLMAQPQASGLTGSSAPNNPEYLAVQSQLSAVNRELAALRAAASRARSQGYEYRVALGSAPGVEKEYAEMVRAHDVLRSQFEDIQVKLREADVARSLETEQKGARFTQIRAPEMPESPFSPNRAGIILLGLLLGVAIGVALAFLAENTDPTVRGLEDLRGLSRIGTIAIVPVLENAGDRRKRLLLWSSYAAGVPLATMLVAITVIATVGGVS